MINRSKYLFYLILLTFICLITNDRQVTAKAKTSNTDLFSINRQNNLLAFKFKWGWNHSNQGAPRGRRSAGTRDSSCPKLDVGNGVTALVPEPEPESVFGLTSAEHPTFWFYLPFAPKPQATEEVEFVLVDTETEEDIYRTTLTLQGTPGIIAIPLPKNQSALAVGKQYRWSLSYRTHLGSLHSPV